MSWIEVSADEKEIHPFDRRIDHRARLDFGTGRHRGDSRGHRLGTSAGALDCTRRARREVKVFLTIQGRRVDATIKTPQGVSFEVQGEVRLDETTSPRRLDWVNFSGADQQEFPQIPAIYKLDRDTFTLCNGGMNGTRPKEFKPGDGALADVVVFERERPSAVAKK